MKKSKKPMAEYWSDIEERKLERRERVMSMLAIAFITVMAVFAETFVYYIFK